MEEKPDNKAQPPWQSFVIKIWLVDVEDGGLTWLGRITHVPGGEKRYIVKLSEIASFILPYLQTLGVHPKPGCFFQRIFHKRPRST